jgi:hypothetical protein
MERFGPLGVREQSLDSRCANCRPAKHGSSPLGGRLGFRLCGVMRRCGVLVTEATYQCQALIELGYGGVEFVELCLYSATAL